MKTVYILVSKHGITHGYGDFSREYIIKPCSDAGKKAYFAFRSKQEAEQYAFEKDKEFNIRLQTTFQNRLSFLHGTPQLGINQIKDIVNKNMETYESPEILELKLK